MQQENELIPHLFRTEYRKVVAVLCKLFGIAHIHIAEDIASDTFLQAAETWGIKGLPPNPVAWLYTVARNKARDVLKRDALFSQKIPSEIRYSTIESDDRTIDIDLSTQNIEDSQLQMMFAVCHPCISPEAQIGLALNILCGFGAGEIADAFLTGTDAIYKRLARAKEKLKQEQVKIELPSAAQIDSRLSNVLTTLYLLFNEGYYSASQDTALRKDLCVEAMRLNYLLIQNERTNSPAVDALMALMCFHASRFDARTNETGENILYEDQDENFWDKGLIAEGMHYLSKAGNNTSKYQLEAAIAYWHTNKTDTPEKWENILQLYDQLLYLEYSPMAALNRIYALAKAQGKTAAITEAEKLNVPGHLYYALLGYLYTDVDNRVALQHTRTALEHAKSEPDKLMMRKRIAELIQYV